MKLIEAMKNLKTIEKRIEKNCTLIREYCALISSETLQFGTEEKQRQEVQSFIQANLDLEKEYLRLKIAIDTTNLNTSVTLKDKSYTIAELVVIKGRKTPDGRKLSGIADFRAKTYHSLSGQPAAQRISNVYRAGIDAQNPPKVVLFYDEAEKNKAISDWDEFVSAIDGKLEVVNAETELQGYDAPAVAQAA